MPTYLIEGKRVQTSNTLTDEEIDEIAGQIKGVPVGTPEGTAGFFEAAKGSTKRLLSSGQTLVTAPFGPEEAALAGIKRQEAITERPGASLEQVKEKFKEGILPGVKEVVSQIPGALGEFAPQAGTMLATGRLGAMAGSAFGPVGTAVGGVGGALLGSFLPQTGSDIERQAQEDIKAGRPVDIQMGKAVGAGVGQAVLDYAGLALGGVGKLIGIPIAKMGTEAAEKAAAKLVQESMLTSGAKGAGKFVMAEMPAEVGQQMLERYQAGLPLTTPDAINEYSDVMYQIGLLGPVGSVARVSERAGARRTKEEADRQRQATLDRVESERLRIDNLIEEAKTQQESQAAAAEAKKLANDALNTLGNYAPEKSKIAKTIAKMQAQLDEAIAAQDEKAQKEAIKQLTNVPLNLASLANKVKASPTDPISDEVFSTYLGIGPTAKLRKAQILNGLDPLNLEDNAKIRSTLEDFIKNKEDDAPQTVKIRTYLMNIPTLEQLQAEEQRGQQTITEGTGAGVRVPGGPESGTATGELEGTRGFPLVRDTDNVGKPTAGAGRVDDTLVSEQNRNRATPASISQMNAIASNPVYEKVSVDNSMTRGAPIVTGPVQLDEAKLGKAGEAIAEDNTRVPVRYAVVEASEVLPSNNADGTPNPQYSRDFEGLRAVVGNGRSAGLQEGYRRGTMEDYRAKLLADESHGISSREIMKMKEPVLVRVADPEKVPANIAAISNETGTMNFSPTERATNDAQNLDIENLENMFSEAGDILPAGYRGFVASLPAAERAEMLDTNGLPTKQAIDRLNAAIFKKAYGNDELVRLQYQAEDPEARNALRAMTQAAPQLVRLEGTGEYDIRPQVAQAAEMVVNAKRKGEKLDEMAKQMDITVDPVTQDIFQIFANNPRSSKAVAEQLRALANNLYSEASQPAEDMFGAKPKRSVSEIIKSAAQPENEILFYKGKAAWSPERIDKLFERYAYNGPREIDDNRTIAFAVYITPQQFLDRTSTKSRQREIAEESYPLDKKKLAAYADEMYLKVNLTNDPNVMEVVGHEGRHRMEALKNSGVNQVPITVIFGVNASESFRTPKPLEVAYLTAQREGVALGVGEQGHWVGDLVPLSYKYKNEVIAKFGEGDLLFSREGQAVKPIEGLDKVTNGSEAIKFVSKLAKSNQEKVLINALRKVSGFDSVKFTTEPVSGLEDSTGYYDPATKTIFVSPTAANPVQTILHELYHAATVANIDNHVTTRNGKLTATTPLGKKMIRVFDAFNEAAQRRNQSFYGQENIKEFFSEANTDPILKNFLENQKSVLDQKPAKGKIATLWSDFVNLIKSMFGIPDGAHTLLDEVLSFNTQLVGTPTETAAETVMAPPKQSMTRADGTPIKYKEEPPESNWQKVKEAFQPGEHGQLRKWMDTLGLKIVGGRYTVERKALDADLPAVDRHNQGKIRGDLINLQALNSISLAQSGLYHGRLVRRKSGLIVADESSGPRKVKMLDISKDWLSLIERATQELGSKERAYDMLVSGWYGPRYAELEQYNSTVGDDDKINIDEWTQSDRNLAKEAWKRYGKELGDLREQRNIQRRDLMKLMVDSGLYTEEKAKQYLDRADYVALYRVPDEEHEIFESKPFMKRSTLLGASKEYRLVGSKRVAADPIDNYIANMSWMMQRAIRNNAAIETANLIQKIGAGQWYDRPMTDAEKKMYHHITINKDGKKTDFRVDDPNDLMAFQSSPLANGLIWDFMGKFSSALRTGITAMPQFVWNQVWEDPIRATITSGNKAGYLSNISNTWRSVLNNQFKSERTPNAELLNRYGIIGQRDTMSNQEVLDMYKGKNKAGWRKSLLIFERMAQGADLGTRESIFENAVKELMAEGYDRETAEDYAAVRAHQYMPHQQVGMSRSLAYIRRMMPFINPPIQGWARDIAAARGRIPGMTKAQGKRALYWRIAKYAMFTGMYAAFMSGDDDYENQGEDQQDNNFFIGGARVPVPQEIRPLKVAVERGTRAFVLNAPKADVDSAEMAGTILRKFWENVAAFNPMPAAVRPMFENFTNFNLFSGLPIVSAGQQRKEPYLQYNDKTSEIAKIIGAQLNYSPLKIDNLLKGYLGYLGQTVGQVSNFMSSDRPAPTANDILFVGSMLENQRATGNRGDFYDLYDRVVMAKASANDLMQSGDEKAYEDYVNANKGYLAIAPAMNDLHNQINKLRNYKQQITGSDMSPEEKRIALDEIVAAENEMLNDINELKRTAIEINKDR